MEQCWNQDPTARPGFEEIQARLKKLGDRIGGKKLHRKASRHQLRKASNAAARARKIEDSMPEFEEVKAVYSAASPLLNPMFQLKAGADAGADDGGLEVAKVENRRVEA
jgi:hypothetical protein